MLIILKNGATQEQIDHVVERIEAMGLQAHLSKGTYRTVIGVIGDEEKIQSAPLTAIPGVEEAVPVMPAYKLASREAHPQPTVVEIGSGKAVTKIGGGHFGMIAGPCAVESAERLDEIAGAIKAAGANVLRGGAFKPRTSPYAFQGLGEEGLKILRQVGDKHGLPVVTEAIDPRHVELIAEYTDMIQLGAEHAELRPAHRGGQDPQAGADEAGHGGNGEGPVDERRVRHRQRDHRSGAVRAGREGF